VALAVGTRNSANTPAVVTLPIRLAALADSVNHRLPSGPTVIPVGLLEVVGVGYSCTKWPEVEITPILFPVLSVNHRFPSGPETMPTGLLLPPPGRVGIAYWVMVFGLCGPILPMLPRKFSVNQMLPSGPVVMPEGKPPPTSGNRVMLPPGVIRPMLPVMPNQR